MVCVIVSVCGRGSLIAVALGVVWPFKWGIRSIECVL